MLELSSLSQLLPSFSPLSLGLNWLDLIIILIFVFYVLEGVSIGFIGSLFDLISFVTSFIVGLKTYSSIAKLFIELFDMPPGFANAFGFFVSAFLVEVFLSIFLRNIVSSLHEKMISHTEPPLGLGKAYTITLNHVLGIVPGFLSAGVLVAFLLSVVISIPLSPFLKHAVSNSKIGNMLVANTQGVEKQLNTVFGGAIGETLNFLTVKPESDEFINLNFQTTQMFVDEEAEEQMLVLVNKERASRGLSPVTVDRKILILARGYSKDMFERGYFSHYNPEGLSPFDRMKHEGIHYQYAGENLALAPNTTIAMQGLMQSPGHKANILSPNFHKVGIGVMDGGIYGEMFTQEFTD